MKCPNRGNDKFERLDFAIVRCTDCHSLFDPYVYPGFPEPTSGIGEIWDTSSSSISNFIDEYYNEWEDEDEEEEDDYDYDEWEDDL